MQETDHLKKPLGRGKLRVYISEAPAKPAFLRVKQTHTVSNEDCDF